MDLSQQKIDYQYLMFTGTPGTRKSTQALTWPKPIFFFSWDKKMHAMLYPMMKWGINPKDVHYEDYSDWNTARARLEQFQTNCPYHTLVFDSITSCADCALRQVAKVKGKGGKFVAEIQVNSIEDYLAESAALMELIALTKDVSNYHKTNIILIAHLIQAEYKSAPNTEANIVRTIVTAGKRVAPKFPAYAEEVYHFFLDSGINPDMPGNYSILTESTTEDFARTSIGLPRKIGFGDKQLYKEWIKPAIDKLNSELSPSPTQLTV